MEEAAPRLSLSQEETPTLLTLHETDETHEIIETTETETIMSALQHRADSNMASHQRVAYRLLR